MTQKRRGNKLGFIIFDFYLFLGIKHAYALLYFVSVYYLLFDRQAVNIISNYVKLRFKNAGKLKRIWHIYKLLISTGKNLIDLRQLEKKPEKVEFECNNEPIKKLIAQKKGLIIMTAHTGNWQVMMRKLPSFGAKMNIVIRTEENPAVSDFLKLDHGAPYDLNIINPAEGMEAVLEIMQELSNGNIVSIMGDRTNEEKQTIAVSFMGDEILLPKGPFIIANSAKAPIALLLTHRKGPCSYALEMQELTIDNDLKNKEIRVKTLAEKYIKTIEEFLTRNPYEWNAIRKRILKNSNL